MELLIHTIRGSDIRIAADTGLAQGAYYINIEQKSPSSKLAVEVALLASSGSIGWMTERIF